MLLCMCNFGSVLWNAKLIETQIFRELSIGIEISLIELKSCLIELKSSLIQLNSIIDLFYSIRDLFNSIRELLNI